MEDVSGGEGLYQRVHRDLIALRGGPGMTNENLRRVTDLLELPIFGGGQIEARISAIREVIVDWLRTYDHEERREALAAAFGLDLESGDHVPVGEARAKLESRRRAVAQAHGVLPGSSLQWSRDREDAALIELTRALIERYISNLEASHTGDPTQTASDHPQVTLDFYRGVDWVDLFERTRNVDILFTYGRSWRRSLTASLGAFFARDGTSMRVVLPDLLPSNSTALPEIAKRAGQSVEQLREHVAEALGFFADNGAALFASDSAELYASYRFDSVVIVSLYNHQRGQSDGIPTICADSTTEVYRWFQADFEALVTNPELSRPVSVEEARLWAVYNGSEYAEEVMAITTTNQGS